MSECVAVMYHYVRDAAGSPFPGLNALQPDRFRAQVRELTERYEIVGLDALLDFLAGRYRPARDLAVLTFDDGVVDHHRIVLPILHELRLPGLFFVITAAIDEHRVVAVHKTHFLMASLGFVEYRRRLLTCLGEDAVVAESQLDTAAVRRAYRWDALEIARFKYFVNFHLQPAAREIALEKCFVEQFGDQAAFARDLYMSWDELRELAAAGMTIGGHSHEHRALAELSAGESGADIGRCAVLLGAKLGRPRPLPFSYPYGKASSFTDTTVQQVRDAGFTCAFATEPGSNRVGQDIFRLRRTDTKELAHA